MNTDKATTMSQRTGSVPEDKQASSYFQGPPRLMGETRALWMNMVNTVRKARACGGKANSDGARKSSQRKWHLKSTSTPGGEGEASSQERNQLVARPEGCPRPSRANRLGGWEAGCGGREEERGARCEGPGRPSKRVEASSQQSRAFPLCYLPLPLVLSALCLPFRRLEKREKQRRKGGGAKGKRRKEERKRGIPVPFCWPHVEMLWLVSYEELKI